MFEWILQTTGDEPLARTMAIHALVAAEVFYLLSISQLLPSLFAKIQGKRSPIAYAPAIGILGVVILQFLFSQLSIMNDLFYTAALNVNQWLLCLLVAHIPHPRLAQAVFSEIQGIIV